MSKNVNDMSVKELKAELAEYGIDPSTAGAIEKQQLRDLLTKTRAMKRTSVLVRFEIFPRRSLKENIFFCSIRWDVRSYFCDENFIIVVVG